MTATNDATTESASLSPRFMFLAALALSLMMGVVDWASGYEFQFFVFYFIPITLAGWNCGLARTMVVSALCGGLWFSIDVYSGHPYSTPFYACWSAMIRITSFLINGYSVVRIKDLLVERQQAKSELRRAQTKIRTLEKLLPICGTCRRIRHDEGYVQQVEEYLSSHTDVLPALGHCMACAEQELRDAIVHAPSRVPQDDASSPSNGTA